MKEEKTKVVYKGIGFAHILTIIFVIAKIVGYINWSWWLVLLPSIISIGLSILVWLVIFVVLLIAAFLD